MMNKVELCGVNTSKLPLLREDEKEELFRRIQKGDEKAREEYIKGNLRLVLSVIKRFDSSSESADDLFQIGCVGLMKAVDNFDPERLVRFSTYAVPMIVGEIRRYLRDNLSRTKISRKAHFSRVTEVVECRQMCWNLHRMQHICSRYATKILICIGHFSVEILGNVLFFV